LTRFGISIGQPSSDPASAASDAGFSASAFGAVFFAGALRARGVFGAALLALVDAAP
jgi:hypothetical protein